MGCHVYNQFIIFWRAMKPLRFTDANSIDVKTYVEYLLLMKSGSGRTDSRPFCCKFVPAK